MIPDPDQREQVPFQDWEIEDSISGRLARVAAAFPSTLAWRTPLGFSLTFAELDRAVNRVANALLERLGPGEARVAFLIEQEGPQIPVILGALRAGLTYVPLDPEQTVERNRFILQDTETSLIIADTRHRSLAGGLASGLPLLGAEEIMNMSPESDPGRIVLPDTLANIYYTTGSTGVPKGVMHSHRSTIHALRATGQVYRLQSGERMANLISSAFVFSLSSALCPLMFGTATMCLDVKNRGYKALADWLEAEEIAIFSMVPSMFRQFAPVLRAGSCPGVRMLVSGGEAVLPGDAQLLRAHFANCELLIHYAGTETRFISSYLIKKDDALPEGALPVGYPHPGKEVLILDESGRSAPPGETGEIAVKSRYLSPGYWRRPDLTASAFRELPEGGPERLYRTGDLGRFAPDGALMHLGRLDSMVKIKGHRVELGEIENALRRLPGVKEAAVQARPNRRRELILAAYIVPAAGGGAEPEIWRRGLAPALPEYSIPNYFLVLDALPLNRNGKLDRRALPEPDWRRREPGPDFLAPRDELESRLVRIFEQVLDTGPIGVRDDFSALGGDSLSLLWLAVELEREFDLAFSNESLAGQVTVERLARWIEAAAERSPAPAVGAFLPGTEEAWAKRLKGLIRLFAALLPYRRLVKLLALLAGPLGRSLFFRRQKGIFERFLAEQGSNDPDRADSALRLFLLGNAGKKTFAVMLSRAGEAEFRRWVRIEGTERLEAARADGKGVILISAHFAVAGLIPLVMARLGHRDLAVLGKWSANLVLMDLEDIARNSLSGSDRSDAILAAQLLRGKEVLGRGGFFEILGDGREGTGDECSLPFLGRLRSFKTGFAQLAAGTGAPVLPVSVSMQPDYTIRVVFHPPIMPDGDTRPDRVESLMRHYALFLEKRWRDDPANIYWREMDGFLKQPDRSARR